WFPEQASTQAGPIDTLYDILIWVSVPVFVTVTIIVLFSVQHFRMRPGEEQLDGPPIHGNTRLEVIWTAIPAVMLVVLCSYAWVVLNDIEEAQANEMRINVVGQQFAWTFEYPQAGGKPIKSTQLYLPKDRPVRFYVKALDVIHDFWVPAFRMKIDAVPGIETKYRITPSRLGTYPVVCAELCGLGHSVMRATTRVVTPAEFNKWIAEQKAPAAQTAGGAVDGKQLFTDGNGTATACGGCHKLADAGTSGTTGPDLDQALAGKDAAFIEEAIVEPDKEIAPGFQAGIMPKNYGDTLSQEERDGLVKYLGEVAGK
ncbi:MAG: cytochrome c oxidase subunit II, partial [Solirubrobacteraceae bacterium]